MIKFEKVTAYKDIDFDMPSRKTKNSAGYDMVVAEDIIVPSLTSHTYSMVAYRFPPIPGSGFTLDEMSYITKTLKAKPTLVPTGVKCYLEEGYYLELSVRSSSPLKYWLILANGVGIIDADYADNPDNEGHIYFQLINLSPFDIQLKKGDIIGQGIIKKYEVTDDDNAIGDRTGGFGSTSVNVQSDAKSTGKALKEMAQSLKDLSDSTEQFSEATNSLKMASNIYPVTSNDLSVAINNIESYSCYNDSEKLIENLVDELKNSLEKGVKYL